MMMHKRIHKHISHLLFQHNCVVIPEFGGFVANYQSAKIESKTYLIHPAKKSILFNKSLQNNDGLLVNEVAVAEGLTFKQSEKAIKKYVEYLRDSLHLHKKIFIEEIGTLLQTSDDTIIFIQTNSKNHLLSSYGFYTLQFPAIERTSVHEMIEEKIKQIPKEKLPSNKKSWLKLAAVILPLATLTFFGVSQPQKWQAAYASLFPITKNNSNNKVVPFSKLDYHIISPSINIKKAVEISHNLMNSNATVAVNESYHFIIAGAFKSEKNANSLVKKLKKWNYTEAKIIGVSGGGLFRVCYTSFDYSQDALIFLKKIKK
jgi:nucleoid DNA-binding protein